MAGRRRRGSGKEKLASVCIGGYNIRRALQEEVEELRRKPRQALNFPRKLDKGFADHIGTAKGFGNEVLPSGSSSLLTKGKDSVILV